MNYNIKGTGFDITDEVRTYVEKKLSALDKLAVRSTGRVDVVLAHTATAQMQYTAEMTLHDAKMPLHAEGHGGTLHEAIDVVSAELVAELSKAKKKRLSNFRHSAVKVKEYLRGWRSKI
jgi:putative sigma-54 modulation protein